MIGALDIGGTKIAAGLVDRNGKVIRRLERPTQPRRGFDHGFELMSAMLRDLAAPITGIGIGCTGPVDPVRGAIENASLLPTWEGADLAGRLGAAFNATVALENDADAAALAESAWGAGRGKPRFLYVTVGTGIGVGIVLDGRLYRGVAGSHPEPGHQVIDASGPLCYCGARGCWEALASGPALEEWMNAHAPAGVPWSAETACRLAAQGDEVALLAAGRQAEYLGIGLANLVNIFSPDAIALGGGLMGAASLFLPRAREVIGRVCTLVPAAKIEIVPAALGADAPLAGAAQAWFHRFGDASG